MEDFNSTLLGTPTPENILQPLVPQLLGIKVLAERSPSGAFNELLSHISTAILEFGTIKPPSPSPEYKFSLGRSVSTSPPESLFQAAGIATSAAPNGFIRQQGDKLVNGQGQPMTFRGIAFGNEVWNSDSNPFNNDHSAIDFQRVKAMGMNSVRFYLNYKWFEDDTKPYQYKATGWQWLDQNVTWAKQNNISLILNMHVPQGGYQSGGAGDALWTNPANQQRLTALWRTIANRYKNETTIAGYGLVNEPITTQSKQQWQTLAQQIANNIRQVDKNHLLFVEGVIGIKTPSGTNFQGTAEEKMIKINDANTVYEFHFYTPYQFTHQGFDWAYNGDGGKYPDYEKIENNPQFTWLTGTFDNPKLAAGQTPWKYVEGVKFKVTDSRIKVAVPALIGENVGSGKVSFDDVVIKEFDPTGKLTRTFSAFNTNSLNGWGFWSKNNSGTSGLSTVGRTDQSALTITGTTDDANISNYDYAVITKLGYSYQVAGWMKGENISANTIAQVRLDFAATNQPIQVRDKAFLASELKPYLDWGKKYQVPLYLGEFGAGVNTFKPNKGGLNWVNDVIDIALANKISFNYHAYHEGPFGLYSGSGKNVDPTKVNLPLKQLFTTKFRNLA